MVDGEAELLTAVEALRGKARSAQDACIYRMSYRFQEILKDNVPVGMKHGSEIHLQQDTASKTPRRNGGRLEAKVGFAGSTTAGELPAWYAHFVDTGSIKRPPSFFSEHARAQATPELQQEIMATFRAEFGE